MDKFIYYFNKDKSIHANIVLTKLNETAKHFPDRFILINALTTQKAKGGSEITRQKHLDI